jgi:outer membrane protein assembly factor BamB
MFQRDGARHGAADAPPIETPTVRWSREVGIAGWLNSPIVANGHVFVATSGQVWNKPDGGDGVVAFTRDGESAWFRGLPGDPNGLAYERCRLFVTSDAGVVAAIDSRSGELLWERELEGGKVYTHPLPLRGKIYVGNADGTLFALDQTTGETVWARALGATIRGGVASDGERLYLGTQGRLVAALDAESGDVVWSDELDDPNATEIYPTPTIVGGTVVFGYARDTYYEEPAFVAFDTATGESAWQATNPRDLGGGWANIRSSPALVDGTLVWGEPYSNRVVMADASTGEVLRSTPTGRCMFEHWPSPATAGGVIYLPRHDGGFYALDVASGALRWSLYLGDSRLPPAPFPSKLRETSWDRCAWEPPVGHPIYASPAIGDDGTVFVATGDGWLHAIGEANESSAAPTASEPQQGEQPEK